MRVLPLKSDRWGDFEELFGEKGACGGCWCMWWRIKRSEFELQKGEGNRTAMRALVDSGQVPGLLAYLDGRPVGWCSVAPREAYPVLDRSRILKPVDDTPLWSVVCFFVARGHRRRGVSGALRDAAHHAPEGLTGPKLSIPPTLPDVVRPVRHPRRSRVLPVGVLQAP